MFSLSLLLFVTTGNNLEELLACWVGEGWVFVLYHLFISQFGLSQTTKGWCKV